MYERDPEDIAMLALPPSQYATFTKMQIDLDALTKRADAQDAFIKSAFAIFDEVAALNKRRAEDVAFAAEFRATGRTPAAVLRRFAKERTL
jgi:hypothetical protein